MGWGAAQVLFGLSIESIGVALGFSIVLGVSAAVGALIPFVRLYPALLLQHTGALFSGLAVVTTEIAEYKSILKTLDPSIPVFNVAGNHDVGNIPSAETLKKYRDAFGRDYYTFTQDGLLGVVLDSNLIRSPEGDPESAKQQEGWLDDQLAAAKATRPKQIVIFQFRTLCQGRTITLNLCSMIALACCQQLTIVVAEVWTIEAVRSKTSRWLLGVSFPKSP